MDTEIGVAKQSSNKTFLLKKVVKYQYLFYKFVHLPEKILFIFIRKFKQAVCINCNIILTIYIRKEICWVYTICFLRIWYGIYSLWMAKYYTLVKNFSMLGVFNIGSGLVCCLWQLLIVHNHNLTINYTTSVSYSNNAKAPFTKVSLVKFYRLNISPYLKC